MLHNPALIHKNPELCRRPKHNNLPPLLSLLLPFKLPHPGAVIGQDQHILELEAWQGHLWPDKLLSDEHHQC